MRLPGKAARRNRRENLRKTSGTEIEIKLRVADPDAILRKLRSLKAAGGARVREMNTLYDTADDSLAREGKLVRIRIERPVRGGKNASGFRDGATKQRALLTYKGSASEGGDAPGIEGARYKVREEREVWIEDAEALSLIFEEMGLHPCFRYEKYRSTYRLPGLPGLAVELDETPIGAFLELEGDSASIDRAAALLGFGRADYISKSYGLLFLEHRRSAAAASGGSSPPTDMLFPSSS